MDTAKLIAVCGTTRELSCAGLVLADGTMIRAAFGEQGHYAICAACETTTDELYSAGTARVAATGTAVEAATLTATQIATIVAGFRREHRDGVECLVVEQHDHTDPLDVYQDERPTVESLTAWARGLEIYSE